MSSHEKRENEDTMSEMRSPSPRSSCASLSDNSIYNLPHEISDATETCSDSRKNRKKRSKSPEPSRVSMNSTRSMEFAIEFNDGTVTSSPHIVETDYTIASYDQTHIRQGRTEAVLQRVKDQHKTSMINKFGCLFEGNKLQENETLLNRIYTQLYII
uniref:FISNA domain-containing protein n=1 Tax=Cyprinus carpio carpio TaxID=630221 RepID=A0A9J7Y815_CYPCA